MSSSGRLRLSARAESARSVAATKPMMNARCRRIGVYYYDTQPPTFLAKCCAVLPRCGAADSDRHHRVNGDALALARGNGDAHHFDRGRTLGAFGTAPSP